MGPNTTTSGRTPAHGLRGRDVVFLYAPPWYGPTRFSKHHLARYWAASDNRVLYVEAPLGPLAVLRRRAGALAELRQTLRGPRRAEPNLWVRRHFNPVPYHDVSRLTASRVANRLGQRWMAPLIRRDLAGLGFRQPILVAGLPHIADALDRLPRRLLVYHCADDYTHVRGFPASLPALEEALCRRADLVVTTSEALREARARFNPRTHWVPNGVDLTHFSSPVEPADELRGVGCPIIGFVGGLSQWVDVPLIASLARQRPGWLFALVGPVGIGVAGLRSLPNVRLLGPRAYTDVPSYLAAMDVALIPFVQDSVTWNADPIKAYEYLAAGVPVVATDLPALRRLAHVVRLAGSAEVFLQEVDAAAAEGREARRAERQAEAARHSWRSRFEQLDALVAEHLT